MEEVLAMDNTGIFALSRGAEKVVHTCLKVRRGEDLAIAVDTPNIKTGSVLAEAGRQAGAEVSLLIFDPRKGHAENPPRPIAAAISDASAAILASTFSLSSSSARREASKLGVRIVTLPGCRDETLVSDALDVDFEAMRPTIQKVGSFLVGGKITRVTTDLGSDLTVKLCGRKTVDQTALAWEPGSWAPVPNLETAVGPCEDGVDGIWIVDGVIIPGGVPIEPVTISIHKGKVVSIEGGADAERLGEYMLGLHDPNIYQVVELGIGLNPKARIGRGLMAEDESQMGTVHLGLGEGRTFGLEVPASTHIDLVVRHPTLAVDGLTILANEQLIEV
jgi:leucyl aminopeptidase (aminopeptidase T)